MGAKRRQPRSDGLVELTRIEQAFRTVGKPRSDGSAALQNRLDRDAEPNFNRAANSGIEQPLQLASKEVEMTAIEQPAGRPVGDSELLPSVRIHEGQPGDRVMNFLEIGQQPQAFRDVVARSEEIDHIALVAQAGRSFDDLDLVFSAVLEAMSQRQSRDPGAGDQDSQCFPRAGKVIVPAPPPRPRDFGFVPGEDPTG